MKKLSLRVLINVSPEAEGRGSFQVGASGHVRFGYSSLSFCSLEKCKKKETVMQDS